MEEEIYKKMYLHLFNEVSDVIDEINTSPLCAQLRLMLAQMSCEKMFIEAGEDKDQSSGPPNNDAEAEQMRLKCLLLKIFCN